MARLWSCGFELNSASTGIELTNTSNFTVQATTVRSGGFAGRIFSLASGVARGFTEQFIAAAGNGPFFPRAYYRFATFPSAENRFIGLNDTNSLSTTDVWMTIDSGGVVRLYDEDGVIGSPSSALSLNVWYRFEFQYDRTPAAGSQVVRGYIDGTEFAGSAARSLSVATTYLICGGNLGLEAQTTGDWYIDDVAINDNAGSFQNSLPGEGEIIHLRPDAAGDLATWARGGTDSGSNFGQVDENPPTDATDFVLENTTNADPALCSDMYNLDATPAAMDSDDVINVVQIGFRCAVDNATGADPDMVLRIEASSGGTVEESAAIDVNNTAWRTNNNGSILNYLFTLYDLPGASTTGWTKADLDAAQAGLRLSVTDTHNAQVTAEWVLVDHKPAGAAPKSLVSTSRQRAFAGLIGR
jgi:hypothetical protein